MKQYFKDLAIYLLESIENIFYEQTLNEYGSEHETKSRVVRYVKKLKAKVNNKC